MIRRVSFKKAILGGVAGAAGWEIAARSVIWAGLPVFDIVRTLGTLVFGESSPALYWWPLGMVMHCLVGSVWATFYAYFFWSTFDRPPWLQGMLFSLLPASLAGLVMVPQLDVMRGGQDETLGIFAAHLGWLGPVAIVAGHLLYGVLLGRVYVRPVGYRRGDLVKINV